MRWKEIIEMESFGKRKMVIISWKKLGGGVINLSRSSTLKEKTAAC